MRLRSWPAVVAAALLAVSGCGDAAIPSVPMAPLARLDGLTPPAMVWSDAPAPEAPSRIVSLIPSATETLFALGVGDRVVGRSDWCDAPPAAVTRPALGSQHAMSVERIAGMRPDLVVFWKHLADERHVLTATFHLNVVAPPTEETYEDAFSGMQQIATAAGVPARGAALVARLRADLAAVTATVANRPRPRALIVLDRDPLYVVGPGSFVDGMFDVINADNVARVAGTPKWAPLSMEKVLDWNPDVILDLALGSATSDAVARAGQFWARFPGLKAVAARRVHCIDGAGVVARPGPRMAAVAARMATLVHDGR